MSETALATTTAMSVVTRINEFNQIADVFSKSGLFSDIRSQGQAFVKIMAGAEIGLAPFTAMNSFHIIQGKVTMSAQAIAARIKSSKRYNYRVIEKTATRCSLAFFENGQQVHIETWDAARANKAGTKNMDKYPEAMLFARAITAGARAVCPDVIGSFYAPEELGGIVTDDGEVIDTAPAPVDVIEATPVATPPPAPVVPPANGISKIEAAKERLTAHAKSLDTLSRQARSAGDITTAEQFDALLRRARRDFLKLDIAGLHKLADEMKAAEEAHIAAMSDTPVEPEYEAA